MKAKLDISRIAELEWEIETQKELSLDILLKDKKYDYLDKIYLVRARLLPMNEFIEIINLCDSNKFKIDEIKFINSLARNYKTDIFNIIGRINEIRKINDYLTKLYNQPILKKKTSN